MEKRRKNTLKRECLKRLYFFLKNKEEIQRISSLGGEYEEDTLYTFWGKKRCISQDDLYTSLEDITEGYIGNVEKCKFLHFSELFQWFDTQWDAYERGWTDVRIHLVNNEYVVIESTTYYSYWTSFDARRNGEYDRVNGSVVYTSLKELVAYLEGGKKWGRTEKPSPHHVL